MKLSIKNHNYSLITDSGHTFLRSAGYKHSKNAWRGARKAQRQLALGQNLDVVETESGQHELTLKNNSGLVLANKTYSNKSNAIRAIDKLKNYIKSSRELATPFPIEKV